MSDTDTLTEPDTKLTEPGDHDRFSHYARKSDITESAVTGEPIRALCGKIWVPPYSDGSRFPVCPECKDIYENILGD